MKSITEMFEDPSYPLRSLRYKFADFVVNKPCMSMLLSAALGVSAIGGGSYMIADEMTDDQTTEFTEAAYKKYSGNIDQLEEQYKTVQVLTARIESGDFQGSSIQDLNNQRYSALESFKEAANPVLAEILLNPALSETQAEALMTEFEQHTIPAEDVHPYFEIEDYGFLREARAEASRENTDLTSIMGDIHDSVASDVNDKERGLSYAMFGLLFLLLPMFMGENRYLCDLARQKPERRVKPKH